MLGSSTNVLTLNGNSTTTWTGRLVVNSGIVRAANPGAFGANGTFIYSTSGTFVGSILAGTTHVSGAANTGRVELTGGLIFAPENGVTAHAEANYTGDRYLNKRNTALAPAFTTIDAGIGFRARRADFRIDGRNLTNRRDAVAESEFGDAQYYRMPAATFRTSVVVRY